MVIVPDRVLLTSVHPARKNLYSSYRKSKPAALAATNPPLQARIAAETRMAIQLAKPVEPAYRAPENTEHSE
jgi:hypothetical protein